ncbi:hypothetical protein [Leptospira idonii]|uniref:Uncharacterized protein n=1 Tax=Leptospira idonii TaxID=1193500 RepID=A0A4V3JXT7_9LEPT|nr:hypothetical protein [Leptospira idonii]TGN18686.1 hypothetical protein EHS15_15045 [Leptospira idonii]
MSSAKRKFAFFPWIVFFILNCSTISIIPEPFVGENPGLVLFGMVHFHGKISFGVRDPFHYTTYRKDFFLFREIEEKQDGTFSEIGYSLPLTAKDVVISDTEGIYFGITSLPTNKKYAMVRYGYMETRSSGSGANRVTYTVPVYFSVKSAVTFPLLPIHVEEGKAKFAGVLGVSESGMIIDGLQHVIEKGYDEDWNHFFGPYETTRKGAAWQIRDKILTYQPNGYWTTLLKKTQADEKLKREKTF